MYALCYFWHKKVNILTLNILKFLRILSHMGPSLSFQRLGILWSSFLSSTFGMNSPYFPHWVYWMWASCTWFASNLLCFVTTNILKPCLILLQRESCGAHDAVSNVCVFCVCARVCEWDGKVYGAGGEPQATLFSWAGSGCCQPLVTPPPCWPVRLIGCFLCWASLTAEQVVT